MRFGKQKPGGLSRAQSMSCRIVRNPDVVAMVREDGRLELLVQTKPARWARFLGGAGSTPVERRIELDELGRFVWERCGESPTVEQLIRSFAQEHRVNLREAEVSVLSFFQMLMKRGLVGVTVPQQEGPG
jgi:hypothetical protein